MNLFQLVSDLECCFDYFENEELSATDYFESNLSQESFNREGYDRIVTKIYVSYDKAAIHVLR